VNQRTHSWIAIRAIALLEDENKDSDLVKLLKPYAASAATGAWIPDQTDAKRTGNRTENHVLKMLPYDGPLKSRFVARRTDLRQRLGEARMMAAYVSKSAVLNNAWWKTPYKGKVTRPGQHLPNRAMGLSSMMLDLLVIGNGQIGKLLPGTVSFMNYVAPHAQTDEEQAALYFFMLSHFVADACMPCHADGRRLAGYSNGLHKELEAHWSRKVGTTFEKKHLNPPDFSISPHGILEKAREVDIKFDVAFASAVPDLIADVWLDMINVCRASFALASIIAPPSKYPYANNRARAPFETVFGGVGAALLEDVDRIVMHDAVLNTAMVWKHAWQKASKG